MVPSALLRALITASAFALTGCAAPGSGPSAAGQETFAQRLFTRYIAFPQAGVERTLIIPGKLQIPVEAAAAGKVPAVIVIHGTGGIDSRGASMAAALQRAGIATLEIDQWSPRGVTSAANRPRDPNEGLPDVYGAFKVLAADPTIDATRIGITGFSWGGVMSILAAQEAANAKYLPNGQRFAAHLPLYPVCWIYNGPGLPPLTKLTGALVRILVGANDHYEGGPQSCPDMLLRLPETDRRAVSVKVYPNATHGFDISEACTPAYQDPAANQGKGGLGQSCPNPAAREDSRREAVEFFGRAFGLR